MRLFVASDAATFAALIAAYLCLRLDAGAWPAPFRPWPTLASAALMTLVLLTSAGTMAMAVRAARTGQARLAVRWLFVTAALGAAFLLLHLNEWAHLGNVERITPTANPWDQPLFGAVFYALTGFHMAHVAAGVVYLGVLAAGLARARFAAVDIETGGIYWQFVDAVWIVLFPLVYLSSARLS